MCELPLPTQQPLVETPRKQPLIANCLTPHYRPLVWTADGRPHPALNRTLQFAADIASSGNGQKMSAKSLQHRWKHEIRSAAMTQAVLPNPSARAEWHLADLIDRALDHWGRVLPFDGRDDDGANTGTDTAIPDDDDDDDIASVASQPSSSLQPSSLLSSLLAPLGHLSALSRMFFQATWSLTLSSKTPGCVPESLPTCLPSNERSTSGVHRDSHLFQSQGDNDIDFNDILASAAAVYMFIKMDPGWAHQPRYPRALTAMAELFTKY